MKLSARIVAFASIASILSYCLFIYGCFGDSKDHKEILNQWEHSDSKFSLERDCPGTLIGRCDLFLFEISAPTWWSPDGKWILKCTSAFRNLDLTFLSDNILAIALYTPSSITVDPFVILNMDTFVKERSMTTRKPSIDWKSLRIEEHTIYSVEIFQAPDDKKDFALNIWKNHDPTSQRNLYVLDANKVSVVFVEDSTARVTIRWNDESDAIDLDLRLWREGDANLEITISASSDSLHY